MCQVCICGAFSSNEEDPSCSLLDISPTAPILSKLEYSMDSSRQYLLIAPIITTKTQLLRSARGCGVAEGTLPGKNVEEMIAKSHRRRKREENVLLFFVCATIINELPVISFFFLFEGKLPAASMRSPCLIYLSASIYRKGARRN